MLGDVTSDRQQAGRTWLGRTHSELETRRRRNASAGGTKGNERSMPDELVVSDASSQKTPADWPSGETGAYP